MSNQSFDEIRKALRDAGGSDWDKVENVELFLAGLRGHCIGTEEAVCNDLFRRQQLGISKYGTTVSDNPLSLREWLQHAYEECLDQAVYLKRAIEEMDKS